MIDSSTPFTIGLFGSTTDTEIRALDALEGISSLWAGGHVAGETPIPEPITGLARLAVLTERVKVGTAVIVLPLYQPAVLAKQVAELDVLTGGRVALGVGVGGDHLQDFRACGVPLSERGARTNDAIEVIRKLWTGETVGHDSRFYTMDDIQVLPCPIQFGGPPIIVGGRSSAAITRAALLGDGWMPYLYSPERYALSVADIEDRAAAAGRDLRGFGWYLFLPIYVDTDVKQARAEAMARLDASYGPRAAELVDEVAAVGNPESVILRLRNYIAAGAQHIVLAPLSRRAILETARWLTDEAIPAVRET